MFDVLGHYWRVGAKTRSITGFMHDAVEDGWWPKALAWAALDAVTRRQTETYTGYIFRLSENDLALRVKLADLNDNLTRNGGPKPSLAKRYKEARDLLTSIQMLKIRSNFMEESDVS